jgi:hypothetical protein
MGGSCIRFQNKPPPSLSLKYKKSCSYLSFSFQHTRSLFYFRIIILCRHSFFVQKQVWITRFKHVPHTHTTRANTDWHTDRSTITRKSNDISKESLSKRKSWISHREKKKEEKKKKETTSNKLLPVHESFGVCFLFTLSVLTAWVVNIVVCSKLWWLDTYTILRWIWFRLPTLQTPKHWVSLSQIDYSLMAPYCFLFF